MFLELHTVQIFSNHATTDIAAVTIPYCRLTKGCVKPLVELHEIRKQQSSSLKSWPLLCKSAQQVEIPFLSVATDISSAQNTVDEVLLSRKVWVAQSQTSVE